MVNFRFLCFFCLGGVYGQLPSGCAWIQSTEDSWSLSGCGAPLDVNRQSAEEGGLGREPGWWLPAQLRPAQARALAIANLTLTSDCAPLWELQEQECSLRVSANWPSAGLQAGPAYLYYRLLVGARSTARGVNITCPLQDWLAVLAARGEVGSGGVRLAPCGTATVTTGAQLLEALQQLQPGNTRVLISLDASMALPTQPTPQRQDPAPDDANPLVRIYRNVTLAGGGVPSPPTAQAAAAEVVIELDCLMRRNAFAVAPEQAAGQPTNNSSRPVFVMADIHLVNTPPGPTSRWPLEVLALFQYQYGLDRSGAGGVQVVGVRMRKVSIPGELEYIGYWYRRMYSFIPEDIASTEWMRKLNFGQQQSKDADGRTVFITHVADFMLGYNSSSPTTPPQHLVVQPDFDLFTSLPPWPPNGTQPPPLPPGSFAVASNAAQLLALLQAAWTGGPRAILLPANITLLPGEWPQGGVSLTYNVTLVGPVAGAPVWLRASGQVLVRSAAAGTATAAPAVTLQLLRLRLVGWSPARRAVGPGELGPQLWSSLNASEGLLRWRDRCSSSAANATTSAAAAPLRYELYGSTLEVPQASLDVLRYYTALAVCVASASTPAAADGCGLQPLLTGPAGVLLQWAANIDGQAVLSSDNGSSVWFAVATLGGGLLVNSSVVGPSDQLAPANDGPCGSASLLHELRSLLPAQLGTPAAQDSPGRPASTPIGAIAGGVVGGAAAVCVVVALLLLALRSRRRGRRSSEPAKQAAPSEEACPDSAEELSSVVVVAGQQGPDGPTGPSPACTAAAACSSKAGTEEACPASAGFLADDCTFDLTFSAAPDDEPGAKPTMMDGLMQRPAPAGGEAPAQGSAGGDAAGAGAGAPWAAMEGELNRLITSFQVVAQAAAGPREGPAGSRERTAGRVLGSGAFGVVQLGEWRGLPVAIKVVLLPLDAKGGRRERLAREVALTVALNHPHIVPTYDFKLNPVREDTTSTSLQEGEDEGKDNSGKDNSGSLVVAMQLRILMQYCELGTLKEGLRRGMFGTAPAWPPQGGQAAMPGASSGVGAKPAAGAAAACRGGDVGGGGAADDEARADASAGAEAGSAGVAPAPRAAAAAAAAAARLLEAPTSPSPAAAGGASTAPRSWDDVKAVPNLALALLGAHDVLSGLEYLHRCGVVHGDLTEGNILLKAVRPLLPAAPPSPPQGADGAADGAARSEPAGPIRDANDPAGPVEPRQAGGDAPAPTGAAAHATHGCQPADAPLRSGLVPELPPRVPGGAGGGSSGPSDGGDANARPQWQAGNGGDCSGSTTQLTATGSTDAFGAAPPGFRAGSALQSAGRGTAEAVAAGAGSGAAEVAERLLRCSFKIADFGLSIQMVGPDQTHASNVQQGTAYFVAPEVVASGRMSTAADCYSFGVILWMLLHGVALADVRHLLHVRAFAPVAPELLRHISPALPAGAHAILRACLQLQPAKRPPASELKKRVEELLREVTGPELSWMLLGAERVETTSAARQPL